MIDTSIFVQFCKALRTMLLKGGGYNALVLTPFALNVYDVYIVINHGVELKAKAPSSI